jgi:hypothetical protein
VSTLSSKRSIGEPTTLTTTWNTSITGLLSNNLHPVSPNDGASLKGALSNMVLTSSSSFEIPNSSHVLCGLEFSNSPPGEILDCSRQFENLPDIDSGQVRTHSLSISNLFKMEEDCEETSTMSHPPSDMNDITRLLTSLSTQITAQNTKLSNEFLQVVQTNTTFKQEVRAEIDELQISNSLPNFRLCLVVLSRNILLQYRSLVLSQI